MTSPVPHKDFSDSYEKMSGKRASAREAHASAESVEEVPRRKPAYSREARAGSRAQLMAGVVERGARHSRFGLGAPN